MRLSSFGLRLDKVLILVLSKVKKTENLRTKTSVFVHVCVEKRKSGRPFQADFNLTYELFLAWPNPINRDIDSREHYGGTVFYE